MGGLVLWGWVSEASLPPSIQPREHQVCVSGSRIDAGEYLV